VVEERQIDLLVGRRMKRRREGRDLLHGELQGRPLDLVPIIGHK